MPRNHIQSFSRLIEDNPWPNSCHSRKFQCYQIYMKQAFMRNHSLCHCCSPPPPRVHMWDLPFYILWFHSFTFSPFCSRSFTKIMLRNYHSGVVNFFCYTLFYRWIALYVPWIWRGLSSGLFPMKLRRLMLRCLVPQMKKMIRSATASFEREDWWKNLSYVPLWWMI